MRHGARPVPVLRYGSVADDPTPALGQRTTSPLRFAEHVAVLARHGCTGLTVTDLVQRMRTGTLPDGPVVAVTFDGGYADVAEHAAPVLAAAGLPATVYVTTGDVGGVSTWTGGEGRRPMLSWDAIRDLRDAGWEVGAHTVSHPELDTLSRLDALYEVVSSRGELQDQLGEEVRSFAYPHGYHSPRIRRMILDLGFHNAAAVKNRLTSARDDRFALARIPVTADMDAMTIARLLDRQGARVARPGQPLGARGWRCYRRVRTQLRSATR